MPLVLRLFVTKINRKNCPTTKRMPTTVILSKAKNLIDSSTYAFEILRLTPQNDVVGQFLGIVIAFEVDEVG